MLYGAIDVPGASRIFITSLVLFMATTIFGVGAQADDTLDPSAEVYFYRCAGCHTVGGGNLSGPDLSNAIKWNNADLRSAIKKMEKNVGPLSDADLDQMIAFLKDVTVKDRIAKQAQKIEASFRVNLPPASFETGQRLFRGEKALSSGGPACMTCHRFVNEGGSLGPDLTFIKDKVSGVALQSAIQNSSYKVMRPIYEKHKITSEEALHLSEFLAHPEQNDKRQEMTIDRVLSLAFFGVSGFFILLWFFNRHRKGRTREGLILRSRKGERS